MKVICNYCGQECEKHLGHYNRSTSIGAPLYCNQTCAGLGRRSNKTIEQRKAEKAQYDIDYRNKNLETKKIKAHEYFKRTYDPHKAAIVRKERMPKHIEYCRQPKYKKWKVEYDKRYHAKKEFGEFAEVHLILVELEKELDTKQIKYDNGLINKAQKRKRQWKNLQQQT